MVLTKIGTVYLKFGEKMGIGYFSTRQIFKHVSYELLVALVAESHLL
jgi:hypothetical protein